MENSPTTTRLSSIGSEEFEDPLLDQLESRFSQYEPGLRPVMRGSGFAESADLDDPFDIEVAKPAAYDLLKLHQLTGVATPALHGAALGANLLLFICHGLTPFYKGGQRPTGVWGIGYTARLLDVDGRTVGFQPTSELVEVAKVNQEVHIGLDVGGSLSVAPNVGIGGELLGISIPSAKLTATTSQSVGLALTCAFSVVAVQAGPVGAGGVRWNLYRAKQSIEAFQPLFQTLQVPADARSLRFEVETWVRRAGYFFGLVGARHWRYPPQTFEVSLAGMCE